MGYFCVFNKRGLVIHEEGKAPDHLNQIIASLDTSKLIGLRKIRDQVMEYEIRGPIVYLSLSRTPNLKAIIDDYLGGNKPKIVEGKKKTRNSIKGRKWEDAGNEEELNYSTSSSGISNLVEVIRKATVQKAFGLFKDEIQVSELKDKMTTHLISKNVSSQITKTLVDNITMELAEEGLESISEKAFKQKMSNVLSRLIPSVDHERMLDKIKRHKGVFSICFVGVNGVGKSTSLAKICYWLLQNKFRVYIAACDTFRAGAIEQLRTHVERFKLGGHLVGFYEKGYGKDDASVARCAIQEAQHEGYDVILIDTAGRMHNKKNLMASLTKLIKINNPDHIIYVGEALVGSDSLDHIREFNKAIGDAGQSRKIDSILLTKVDTVDNKIGQILNMAFSSHAPILFLGVGQSNSDLSNIGSEDIVNSLMSS
ncbi:signal recognition particle GTPase [Encephalitozoon romaleae SJ-2008]|uniref:Signal recognition particle receptor subunit alpha homolog n=1 Tax=Encephalitozoon romaleae (strain SJ-2008) TaxID=1178016 RepID=I7ATM3_ENCRO|nr:signal recognition particle GTPase [Encephalitozoon romaleae SJ-2008]AFN83822.1 signal recognition particle GTPase [Encephalitozoon romaleae SJ-2008]